jgi:hypothetical protein
VPFLTVRTICKFEEIWSDFPKFRNSEKKENRRKKNRAEISGKNFSRDFQNPEIPEKVCCIFGVFRNRSAQQGTPLKLGKIEV